MRDLIVRLLFACVLVSVLLSLNACQFNKTKDVDQSDGERSKNTDKDSKEGQDTETVSENRDYLGEWFDINSDSKLEIKEKSLVFTLGNHESDFPYKLKMQNKIPYLMSKDPGGSFSIMSKIEVKEDGSLEAYEEVVDKNPHQFRFVREETLKSELEILDVSMDLPKKIDSNEINNFELQFYNNGKNYNLSDKWPIGAYKWEIQKEEDGSYQLYFNIFREIPTWL